MDPSTTYSVSPRYAVGEVEDTLHLLGGRELVSLQLPSGDAVSAVSRLLSRPFTRADVDGAFGVHAPVVADLVDELVVRDVVVGVPTRPAADAAPDPVGRLDDPAQAELAHVLDEARRNGGDRTGLGRPRDPRTPARVALVGDAIPTLLTSLAEALPSAELTDETDADLVIAAGSRRALREVGDRMHAAGRDWLPIHPFDGRFQLVGPVVVPDEGPCHECVALRWASTTPFAADHAGVADAVAPVRRDPGLDAIAAGFAARYAARWVFARDWLVASTVLVVEPKVLSAEAHPVFRVARCGTCGPRPYAGVVSPWRA
ncbi:TOMM precursor leader peptide-binding protein [Clavibacter sp. VKM Ac-2873]|uniref:TOMM precursor leader peptide-binding protein n=1 Tax=Clavibacter sp. VKM Ac-2873 TaxID=2783813 RepID=UPI00188D321B|nr:TOMM precursor leader peptide-binding protein [Clavibacter sp. VKM Ac-2873]MBF4618148.1 TOMM precursor leader peptide-binding protein [Clavibacter sp. VKM Ac-2873]